VEATYELSFVMIDLPAEISAECFFEEITYFPQVHRNVVFNTLLAYHGKESL